MQIKRIIAVCATLVLAIRGGNAGEDSARDDIEAWLDGLNLN